MLRLHILGAGTPTPTLTRFGSAFVLDVDGEKLMFDCGPATTHKLVKAGLWPTDIDYLFFTHHHSDHNADYPCFLMCRWDQSVGKERTLSVFGPQPTEAITEGLIGSNGVFAVDWKARIAWRASQQVHVNRGGTLPRPPPEILAKDVEPGHVTSTTGWDVTAAVALHAQPYLDCLAYRLDASSGGSVVFTGDTAPCESVVNLAKGADTLVCMCWDLQAAMVASGENLGMSGTIDAAQMARDAGVGRLILVHLGSNIASTGPMEQGRADIRERFDGEFIFADELQAIDLDG